MSRKPFHFKQFDIYDDKCSMKVGTDGVLLGAWANVNNAQSILDIGTGTGLIAMMLAQRTLGKVYIDAVEIEENAFQQAIENVNQCPWQHSIEVHHEAIQDYANQITTKYDLIVSNPPFFTTGTKSKSSVRDTARHTLKLSHNDLLIAVKTLLSDLGKFALILPKEESEFFRSEAEKLNLFPNKITFVKPKIDKNIERVLTEFSPTETTPKMTELVIQHDERNNFTEAYKAITRDFYTIME